ncbi:MAG: hypothetical protein ACRCS9_06250 [Hyphomicrobium sp.]
MVGSTFLLIRMNLGSTVLAAIFTPAITIGALAANYVFQEHFIHPLHDKNSNVVLASAVGVVVALLLMMVAAKLVAMMSEARIGRLQIRRELPASQLPEIAPPAEV